MSKTTALALAKRFAARVKELTGETDEASLVVPNKQKTATHGWIPGALASVSYEGLDLAELSLREDFTTDKFYLEPYSSWLVGVYRR